MKFLIVAFIAALLCSCSAIKNRSITNDLAGAPKIVDRVKTVCETAELFTAVGVEVPGAKQCVESLKKASPYYETVFDVSKCVRQFDPKTRGFRRCISNVELWPMLAGKL